MNAQLEAHLKSLSKKELRKKYSEAKEHLANNPDDASAKEFAAGCEELLNREEKPEGTVKVVANEPINEDGFHAKGEEFACKESRLPALGALVTKVGCLLAFLLFAAGSARADVTQYEPQSVSCTNNVPNNSTTTANLGSAITCTKFDEVAIQINYELNGAGTTACTFNFAKSVDGSTFSTTAQHAITFAPNGTTTVSTNLVISMGSAGYLKMVGVTAANNSAAMTNIVVKYVLKPNRHGNVP